MTLKHPQSNGRARVLVVGAGIVGTCCALWLQRHGFAVTLLDRNEPGSGCSAGNAGILHSGSVLPLATVGILRRVPQMLLDPDGPLGDPLAPRPVADSLAHSSRQPHDAGRSDPDIACAVRPAERRVGCRPAR